MGLMERVREYAYWTLDAFQGKQVGKYYKEVQDAYKYGILPEQTDAKLNKLLNHAVETTEYYGHLRGKTALSLQDFPIMNKSLYLEHYEECLSSALRNAEDNRIMYTSGSTGTPFSVVQNKDKILHNTASALFINSLGGYRLGDRQAFLRVWVRACNKSLLRQKMENLFPVDTTNLDAQHLKEICRFLQKRRITSIIGYASSLTELSNYIEEQHVDTSNLKVRSVITISEHLAPLARAQMQKQFRCPVNAQYSNEENGIMAIQEGNDAYYVESSSWHIEILKLDSDEPAEDGELGRVVITDLYNYAFPMIRYDNGDTVVARHQVDEAGRYRLFFEAIYGRRSDVIFDLNGNPISPHVITNRMWETDGIRQWKFVQKGKGQYCFYINACDQHSVDERALISRFKDLFGDHVTVEFVDEIPVLASGKRKYIEFLAK